MCVIFVVFTDCESCTRPISTADVFKLFIKPRSMEAGEHGQTRGTWFFARRLEVVAVAGLMWVSWCVFGGVDFSCFFSTCFFLRTHTACCKYQAASCLIYLSICTGVRTGCHYLISLSVCVRVCDIEFVGFFLIARAVRGRFPQTRYLWKRASMG